MNEGAVGRSHSIGVVAAAALGLSAYECVDITHSGQGWHNCTVFEIPFTGPFAFELHHQEPRQCPVDIQYVGEGLFSGARVLEMVLGRGEAELVDVKAYSLSDYVLQAHGGAAFQLDGFQNWEADAYIYYPAFMGSQPEDLIQLRIINCVDGELWCTPEIMGGADAYIWYI